MLQVGFFWCYKLDFYCATSRDLIVLQVWVYCATSMGLIVLQVGY